MEKIIILILSISSISLFATAADPEMRLAVGYVEAYQKCHQRQELEACEAKQKIGDYNNAVEACNERGFFGGQSQESIDGCKKARDILIHGGITLAED